MRRKYVLKVAGKLEINLRDLWPEGVPDHLTTEDVADAIRHAGGDAQGAIRNMCVPLRVTINRTEVYDEARKRTRKAARS